MDTYDNRANIIIEGSVVVIILPDVGPGLEFII